MPLYGYDAGSTVCGVCGWSWHQDFLVSGDLTEIRNTVKKRQTVVRYSVRKETYT
jgi:hypothetical protein